MGIVTLIGVEYLTGTAVGVGSYVVWVTAVEKVTGDVGDCVGGVGNRGGVGDRGGVCDRLGGDCCGVLAVCDPLDPGNVGRADVGRAGVFVMDFSLSVENA